MTDPIRDRLVALLHRAATEAGDYGTSPTNGDTWGCVCGTWGPSTDPVVHETGCPVAEALELLGDPDMTYTPDNVVVLGACVYIGRRIVFHACAVTCLEEVPDDESLGPTTRVWLGDVLHLVRARLDDVLAAVQAAGGLQ